MVRKSILASDILSESRRVPPRVLSREEGGSFYYFVKFWFRRAALIGPDGRITGVGLRSDWSFSSQSKDSYICCYIKFLKIIMNIFCFLLKIKYI